MQGLAQAPIRIDAVMPSTSQLGGSWTSNRVVVVLDPLSSPNEVSNEGKGWLQAAGNVVGKQGCNSYCVVRYFWTGQGSFLVWSKRYETKEQIGEDWGKDHDGLGRTIPSTNSPPVLPNVGDEVRFYQRHGMHNNIAFRRGEFVFDVEGHSIPHLKELAEAIDGNLIKVQEVRKKAVTEAKDPK
jgi:hypothetical protein